MVMILIGFASAFSYRMAIMQLPANLSSLFLTVSDNKYVILLPVGKVTIEQVMKEIWPFYGAMLVTLALVTYVPAISTWLPSLFKF